MFRFIKIFLIVIILSPFCAQSEVSLAPIFNDGAVLQCDMPVNVWGTADPGAEVTVSFAGQEKCAVTDSSKHWKIVLDPMPASSEPRKLDVRSSIGSRHSSIVNVSVGEVWLAAGQSNMRMTLKTVVGGAERLAKTLPQIHFSIVPQKTGLPVEHPLSSDDLNWRVFSPGQNGEVSAVAFFFAEKIQNETGRPVGVIQSAVGGTPCQAWMPLTAIEDLPDVKYMADELRTGLADSRTAAEWKQQITDYSAYSRELMAWKKDPQGSKPVDPGAVGMDNPFFQKSPSVLFENMIRPLIPYTARGVIWYQGETGSSRPDEYRVLFPALIKAWREAWARPEWPFFFVQLAAYDSKHGDFAGQRAVQTFVRDTVPHTGMALAIDCGEKTDIHPKEKEPVGTRLARLALADVYGKDVVSRGPVFQALEKKDGKLRVIFQCSEKSVPAGAPGFQGSEKGLRTSSGKAAVPGFEVAGSDGVFHPAQAQISGGDSVELTCPAIHDPVSVRYAWHSWIEPPVTLQNSEGLPAEPFVGTWEELDE